MRERQRVRDKKERDKAHVYNGAHAKLKVNF